MDVFNPAMLAQVNGIIHQHMGNTTDDLEEAALTPITPTLAPAAETSHPSDHVAGNSAQADGETGETMDVETASTRAGHIIDA